MSHVRNTLKTQQTDEIPQERQEELSELLQRVAGSNSFQRAHRLRAFLLYIGTHSLEARTDEITEQKIGTRVFGRSEDFSTAEDNIVRTAARMLRLKLREHFDGEGREEHWRIEIPKGSYVPLFTPQSQDLPIAETVTRRKWPWLAASAAGLLVLGLAIVKWYTPAATRNILSSVMGGATSVMLVGSDTLHTQLQLEIGRLTPLEDYASGNIFRDRGSIPDTASAHALWPAMESQLWSHQDDLRIIVRLARQFDPAVQVELQHPRQLRMSDLKSGGDFLLIAGQRANPWVGLFEQNLNYQLAYRTAAGPAEIENKKPQPGEQRDYVTVVSAGKTGRSYARIGLVPGLGGQGRVLLIAGSTGQATDAAGEVLLNPASLIEVERLTGRKLDSNTKRLDVLIETVAVGGSTREYRIVGAR